MKELKAFFYILAEPGLKERDLYACRVIEKAYLSAKSVYVYLGSQDEAEKFDTQLWTFRDVSFVPHAIGKKAPVVIGCGEYVFTEADILVNLSGDLPIFYKQFKHIIEVVPNDDNFKKIARKHYKLYQDNNYTMEKFLI